MSAPAGFGQPGDSDRNVHGLEFSNGPLRDLAVNPMVDDARAFSHQLSVGQSRDLGAGCFDGRL
jgi:hypothetical protein